MEPPRTVRAAHDRQRDVGRARGPRDEVHRARHEAIGTSRSAQLRENVFVGADDIVRVEYDDTAKLFTRPSDKRTEDYVTGRFG